MGISQPAPRALTCGGHPRTLPPEASDGLDRETSMPDISAKPENQEPSDEQLIASPLFHLACDTWSKRLHPLPNAISAVREAQGMVDRHLLEAIYVMLRCR